MNIKEASELKPGTIWISKAPESIDIPAIARAAGIFPCSSEDFDDEEEDEESEEEATSSNPDR